MSWLVVYSEDGDVETRRLLRPSITLLKTGSGKVRAATAVQAWLTSALRGKQERPKVLTVGPCYSVTPGLLGTVVRPAKAVDYEASFSGLVRQAEQPPAVALANDDGRGLVIGSSDRFKVFQEDVASLRFKGVGLLDVETHAVAWTALRCLAGKTVALRYVSAEFNPNLSLSGTTPKAVATVLTDAVLELTSVEKSRVE